MSPRGAVGRGRSLAFSRRELRDLGAAWVILGLAFTILLNLGTVRRLTAGVPVDYGQLGASFLLSVATVGVGFLLHELAHKVVAVHFDQVAEFRADYHMLVFALLGAMVGFLFAAPGAVHHRGRITERQRGLIALAGPVVNGLLAVGFLGLATVGSGFLATVGGLGLLVNLLLAGFNMVPIGPLDGRTVLSWNPVVYVVVAAATIGPAFVILFDVGL